MQFVQKLVMAKDFFIILFVIIASYFFTNDAIAGGYHSCNDLESIKKTFADHNQEFVSFLKLKQMKIDDNVEIIAMSAECQVVAGINYEVTINVTPYSNVIIKYFIALGSSIPTQMELITRGAYKPSLTSDDGFGTTFVLRCICFMSISVIIFVLYLMFIKKKSKRNMGHI